MTCIRCTAGLHHIKHIICRVCQKAVAAIDNADVIAELSPDSDILSPSLTFSLLTADDKKIISDKITLTTLKINL